MAVKKATTVHFPQRNQPILLITDAREQGGGASILQVQTDPETNAEHLVFLGHWAWKWSGARLRYAMY